MSEKGNNQEDNLIGATLGQYTILEEIGRGGMATVYKARQQSVNRVVAVKVLPPHFLHDPGFLERFTREVDVASHLEHPHILPIYDYGEADGVPFITMRFLGGGSMAQLVRRGIPTIEWIRKPFMQVAQGLDYAHQEGVIHRDLKPGNIMLDEHNNAYLADFGIARVFGSNLTGSMIIGTPAYMSPEQANGLPIDSRSDIYALGIVLFELITGREPFQAETPMALLLKHINEPMPPLRDFRQGVPDLVEDVIAKSTDKEPDERYSSATEMAEAFDEAVRSSGEVSTKSIITPPAEPAPVGETAVTAPIPPEAGTAPVVETVQIHRASTGLLLTAVAIVAIVVIAAIVIVQSITNNDDTTSTTPPEVALVPTPFARSTTITQPDYTISIPDVWRPELSDFTDNSDTERLLHTWQDDDGTVSVALAITDEGVAIEDYADRHYSSQEAFNFIDEATSESGTVRHSYRVENNTVIPNGQIDVFYMQQDGKLVALEVYTADSIATDVTLISRLQLILDSLRLTSEA